MPASVRTLSQLPGISAENLMDRSKLEVSVPVELSSFDGQSKTWRYASKSITAEELSKKIFTDTRRKLVDSNGLSDGLRVDELKDFVGEMASADFVFDGTKTFTENPIIDNTAISAYSLTDDSLDDYSVNYGTLKKYANVNSAPAIGPNFGFVTRLSGFQSGSQETERPLNIFKPAQMGGGNWAFTDKPYFVFNSNVKNLYPDEYIFKIKRGERESPSWKAPASGIFTCYGWLDEINNPAQSNESRWVALMGKQAQLGESGWTILQVQPFIKNNYLSYVGFTFPVKKGMELKVVTGFAVGSNSDKYFASNSSLANHVANAFIGGIYTGLSADNGEGVDYDYEETDNGYVVSADLYALCGEIYAHEEECDRVTSGLIMELSNQLSNGGSTTEINKRVKFIDPTTQGWPVRATIKMYNARFKKEDGEDSAYMQTCLVNGSVTDKAPLLYKTLQEIATNNVRSYYAPPTFAQMLDSGEMGYIEKAYSYKGIDDLYGRVFSDGKYMFYCVSQDCTALIRLHNDFSSKAVTSIAAYMLLPKTAKGDENKILAINIGKSIETVGSVSDPVHPISLPVKAGTIFMFVPWGKERVWGNTAVQAAFDKTNETNISRNTFAMINMPPNVPNADWSWTEIGNIYNYGGTQSINVQINGVTCQYNSYAIWTSDDAQRNKLITTTGKDEGTKYSYLFGNDTTHGDYASGTIATVVELP